ncbi:MAG: hypothetical protein ACRYGF_17190 [Janthinobacterium lividum]
MPDTGHINSVVLQEGSLVITLSDQSFLVLTLNQLLSLGVTRHQIPADLLGELAPKKMS